LLHYVFGLLKHLIVKRAKPTSPLVFRLEEPLHQRLEECAKRLKLKKYTLGIMAIEAAAKAIEENGYRLVVPIEFDVAQVPAPKKEGVKYPDHRSQVALVEDASSSKGTSDKAHKDISKAGSQSVPGVQPKTPKAP
jgi:hypothetical protein